MIYRHCSQIGHAGPSSNPTLLSSLSPSTQAQLSALNGAFATQEQCLMLPEPPSGPGGGGGGTGAAAGAGGAAAGPDGFPYLALLKKWREEAVRAVAQRVEVEQRAAAVGKEGDKSSSLVKARLDQVRACLYTRDLQAPCHTGPPYLSSNPNSNSNYPTLPPKTRPLPPWTCTEASWSRRLRTARMYGASWTVPSRASQRRKRSRWISRHR